jgi:hypothetical protein
LGFGVWIESTLHLPVSTREGRFGIWDLGFGVWIEFTLHLPVSKEGEESNIGADVENVTLASLPIQGLEFRVWCLGFGDDDF